MKKLQEGFLELTDRKSLLLAAAILNAIKKGPFRENARKLAF